MARRKVEQLGLFKQRGGKRRGAGRKPKGLRAGAAHKKRPVLRARHPVHVVLRVVRDVGNLRRKETYHAIRKATETVAGRDDFRIVHISIQANHIHLIVEAADQSALSRNVKGFQISAARNINAAISSTDGSARRGTVFPDRFHESIITTPKQARHTLAYLRFNRPIDLEAEPDASADTPSRAARPVFVEEVALSALAM
ncbi:MAG: hypothetical protein HC774_01910 [Sphingomonadales bacterium]|nr:hypothetical protein [Sphingomonadales bacterium]